MSLFRSNRASRRARFDFRLVVGITTTADLNNQRVEAVVSGGRNELTDSFRRRECRANNPERAYFFA